MTWERLLYRDRIPYLRRSTGMLYALCVFHQEKTPSLRFHPAGHFHCFGCQHSGTMFSFLVEYRFANIFDLEEAHAAAQAYLDHRDGVVLEGELELPFPRH